MTIAGMLLRKGPSGQSDRDNLIFADGLQGVTFASLIVVAFMVHFIDSPKAVAILKEQSILVSIFALLGGIQMLDRFRRSLTQ